MQNLPLDGNIQCSGRFIGNDQIWFVQKRDRDRDSLPHSSGKLMGIGPQSFIGRCDADFSQGIPCQFPGCNFSQILMRLNGLNHLGINPQHGVERHHRILENHCQLVSTDLSHFFFRKFEQISSLEKDLSSHNLSRCIHKSQDGKSGDGFSRPRFSHQAKHFTASQGEADIFDGFSHTIPGKKMGPQMPDIEGGFRQADP